MRRTDLSDATCAIAQALQVVGDWWTLLIVRDVAAGITRFDGLQSSLGLSRKVLAVRLRTLVEHGVLERREYSAHPPRHDYLLTSAGRGLLPVLVTLQDWGSTFVLGDGTRTATAGPASPEAQRVHDLVGQRVPPLSLPAADGGTADPVSDADWTVLYCYPGTYVPGGAGHPPGWDAIPGAPGCTLESCTYRDRLGEFAELGAAVRGISTQRSDEQRSFAAAEGIAFPLLSDAGLELTAALRLPTFRVAGNDRLKRLTLVADRTRTIRSVLYPVPDVTGSVEDALAAIRAMATCRT